MLLIEPGAKVRGFKRERARVPWEGVVTPEQAEPTFA